MTTMIPKALISLVRDGISGLISLSRRSFTGLARHQQSARTVPVLLVLALASASCDSLDSLLDVQPQDRVPSSVLDDPAEAGLLVDGVVTTFDCAFGAYSVIFGLIADELGNAQGNIAFQMYDKRDQSPSGGASGIYSIGDCYVGGTVARERFGIYKPLSSARWFADHTLAMLESWSDAEVMDRTKLIAKAAAYSGYSHILLGEGFCSAAVDGGPELSSAEVLGLAEQRFTRAIEAATAAGDQQMLGLALVGRARARLDLGRSAEAAADARLVPAGFMEAVTAATNTYTRYNRLYQFNNQDQAVTVAASFRGLSFGGVPDPRVPVSDAGRLGNDNRTPLWVQQKYKTLDSSVPLATWVEAQLIIAEAEQGQTAVDIINVLHERAGLPAFSSNDPAEIRAHVQEERRRELFLDSHRMYDVIRLGLDIDPMPGSTFTGSVGGLVGNTTCLPLPDVERDANPNIS
jgi:hypothetical protein